MNSETPSQDEKDEITSLVASTTRELRIQASLITRGLQDIGKPSKTDPSRSAEEAIELYDLGKFSEAVALCNSALGIDPDFDVVLLQIKGTSLARQDHFLEGIECIDQALKIKSDDLLCWFVKSRLFQMANRIEERLECLQRVIEIDSTHKKAWKESGYCLLELGRYEEAAEAFDSVLRLDPSDEDCGLQKAIALAEMSGGEAEDVDFMVVYEDSKGWHVMKEDDIQWEFERANNDGRERSRPSQSCYGPFFSNYDPNEGPVGSGKAQAEADAEEKRRLYPNGPPRKGAGSDGDKTC